MGKALLRLYLAAEKAVMRRADDNPGLGAGRMDYLASANIDRHMIDGIPAGIKQRIDGYDDQGTA